MVAPLGEEAEVLVVVDHHLLSVSVTLVSIELTSYGGKGQKLREAGSRNLASMKSYRQNAFLVVISVFTAVTLSEADADDGVRRLHRVLHKDEVAQHDVEDDQLHEVISQLKYTLEL